MYIFIFEDGTISKSPAVSGEEFKSAGDGDLSIINITDPEKPLDWVNEEWVELDNC